MSDLSAATSAGPGMPPVPLASDPQFGGVEIPLSVRQCLLVAGIVVTVLALLPAVTEQAEPLPAGKDFRIPYALSGDYWLFSRLCGKDAQEGKVLVLGDSVIWGEYVAAERTLPACLNARAGRERFANLGVDGMYPVALEGLVRYFGRPLRGGRVVLHCNLLWLASDEHDLRAGREFRFNHPALVPQFLPRIQPYQAPFGDRVEAAVDRVVPFRKCVRHWRAAACDGLDLPTWTMDHPYEIAPSGGTSVSAASAAASAAQQPDAGDWQARGLKPQDFPWVDLAGSPQWQSFRRTVEILQERGNTVFVVLGPFNEHMLAPRSLAAYRRVKAETAAWLAAHADGLFVPEALPAGQYADASHPLADGYAALARALYDDPGFRQFCGHAPKEWPIQNDHDQLIRR